MRNIYGTIGYTLLEHKNGKNKIGIVLNLDEHDGKGSHWVSVFIDLQKKFIFYFESTGSITPPEIDVFVKRMNEQCKSAGLNMKLMNNMKIYDADF